MCYNHVFRNRGMLRTLRIIKLVFDLEQIEFVLAGSGGVVVSAVVSHPSWPGFDSVGLGCIVVTRFV